nr:aryl-sulfate sulfotransferase [uncultured Pseudodesulfovibrio sp.]
MQKNRLIITILCVFLFSATAHAGILYVNEKAPQPGDGRTWTTAFKTLTQALDAAQGGDQIWVAEGIYLPTESTDRNASFQLKKEVELYGGFSGSESELKKRDIKKHQAILSGDIGQPGVPDDNVFHVIIGADMAVLDGFTITGGYSLNTAWTGGKTLTAQSLTTAPQPGFGAGMLNFQAAPEVRNCVFQDNYALMGGAVYNMTAAPNNPTGIPASSPKFIDCTFWQNSALAHGGGVVNTLRTAPLFVSCVFDSNIADISGGGMFNDFGAAPMLLNSIFRNNEADNGGGMVNEGGSTPILYYSTLTGNRSMKSGPAIYQGAGAANTTVLTKSVVWDNECEGADIRFFNGDKSVVRVQDSVIQNGYKGKSVFQANPGLDRKSETMLNVGYKTNGHRFRAAKLEYRIKDIDRFEVIKNLPAYDPGYMASVDQKLLDTMNAPKTASIPTPETVPAPVVAAPPTMEPVPVPKVTSASAPAASPMVETIQPPAPKAAPVAIAPVVTQQNAAKVTAPAVEKTPAPPVSKVEPESVAMLTPTPSILDTHPAPARPSGPPNAEVLMLSLDMDGNGCISINEATGEMQQKFWRMDLNGDNCLSKTELARASNATQRPKQPMTRQATAVPATTVAAVPQKSISPQQPKAVVQTPAPAVAPKQVVQPAAQSEGYTLFSPIGSKDTHLVDMRGNIVKTWRGKDQSSGAVYLLNNGNLLRSVSPGKGEVRTPFTGKDITGGIIQEVSPRGQIVWEYTYVSDKVRQHHDIAPLPNGNVLLLAWELKTESDIQAVGGTVRNHPDNTVWAEHIVEVRKSGPRSGYIVWEWHAWDHLIQNADQSAPNFANPVRLPQRIDINYNPTRNPEWLNANSIDYNPQLKQIILSLSNTGEVWIIDHSTNTSQAASSTGGMMHRGGEILFRWGNPQAYGASGRPTLVAQRDARWVLGNKPGEEHILIFNNGNRQTQRSDIIEIKPEYYFKSTRLNANIVWSYNDKGGERFFAEQVSGAQRLENGHTLFSDGPAGRIVEVSTNAKPVWEYNFTGSSSASNNQIFRASRIPGDHPGLRRLSIN